MTISDEPMTGGVDDAAEPDVVLEVRDLAVAYGQIRVVDGVSFRVRRGRVACLIGSNGAGKTTTLRGMLGLDRVTAGTVEIVGTSARQTATHHLIRQGLALVPEGRRVFKSLSVLDNLRMGAVSHKGSWREPDELARPFELFPELDALQDRPAGLLSGGEQQMLAIGRALMSRPSVLLLDEPSMGLAPVLIDRIYDALAELKGRGTSILLAEQNARLALALSDWSYILETGKVVDEGPADSLRTTDRVQRIYLGG